MSQALLSSGDAAVRGTEAPALELRSRLLENSPGKGGCFRKCSIHPGTHTILLACALGLKRTKVLACEGGGCNRCYTTGSKGLTGIQVSRLGGGRPGQGCCDTNSKASAFFCPLTAWSCPWAGAELCEDLGTKCLLVSPE